jgi:hypothetical protein
MEHGPEEWMKESFEDGIILGVTAYHTDATKADTKGYMVDQHIGEIFEELSEIGLEDETEGFMSYYDSDITAEEMVTKLTELGFVATIDERV